MQTLHCSATFVSLPNNFKVLIFVVGKKSTNMLACEQTHFATDSQIDVKISRKWWILMLHQNCSFWLKNLQNAWIHSLNWFTSYSHSTFSVFDECVLRIWPRKNAACVYYATPKFWHKIRDSEKTVDFLLNRPRLPLGKSLLQLWSVLKIVYNAYWWP